MWNRDILGWDVHAVGSADLVARLVERIRGEAGDIDVTGWVLHSDNGALTVFSVGEPAAHESQGRTFQRHAYKRKLTL